MAYVEDAFTDADGTNLAAHTPTVSGTDWTDHPSYTGSRLKIHGNRVYAAASTACCYADPAASSEPYKVSVDFEILTLVGALELAARIDPSADTMYLARLNASGDIVLLKRVTGTATSIRTHTAGLTAGATGTLELEVGSGYQKVRLDGAVVISETDTAITAVGRGGIRAQASASTTTGTHVDNLKVAAAAIVVSVGRAIESDSPRAVSAAKRLAAGRAVEAATARAITALKRATVGRATESGSARLIRAAHGRTIGRVLEVGSARSVAATKRFSVGRIVEQDHARVARPGRGIAVGRAVETDAARVVRPRKRIATGRAVELDLARVVSRIGGAAGGVVPPRQTVATASRSAAAVAARSTSSVAPETEGLVHPRSAAPVPPRGA